MSIEQIEIKKLTPDLIEDYLHFFDVTPHSEKPESEDCKCYCVWWCRDVHNNDVFDKHLSTREKRKEYARVSIQNNQIQGYLAYFHGEVVGWCNTNTKSDCYDCFCWQNFMKQVKREENAGKVKSVFCFLVASSMRGKGVATKMMQQVCEDAKKDGFITVEGYPNKSFINQAEDFMGPAKMYENLGFTACYETDQKIVMRKELS